MFTTERMSETGPLMRCLAIDDEPLALKKLGDYVSRVSYLELKGQFGRPVQALEFIHMHAVDLLFLDIQMDLLTGIQLLESLHPRPFVIITTAYPQFALKGFDLDVSDYLLKPFNFDRFLKATDRVYKRFCERGRSTVRHETTPEPPGCLFVKNGRVTECINPSEILYVEGMSEYLAIHLEGRKVVTLMSFGNLEKQLPAGKFLRIHRSYMVSIEKIESLGSRFVRVMNRNLPIGDKYREALLENIKHLRHG